MTKKIYLLTEERFLQRDPKSWYSDNIFKEDQLLTAALEEFGYETERFAWDGNDKLPSGSLAIFRSTWNYFKHIHLFKDWLMQNKSRGHFLNPIEIILWNLDKRYLFELAKDGVSIIDSLLVWQNTRRSLASILESRNWQEIIIKPTISAVANNTFRLNVAELSLFEERFQHLISSGHYLIQEFQKQITSIGEVSMIFIDGHYSHAVLKQAKTGEYRVQDDFGGQVQGYRPTTEQIDLGKKAIQACPGRTLYARVDIVLDNNAKWAISELELIEPELWMRRNHTSATRLAAAIASYVSSLSEFVR